MIEQKKNYDFWRRSSRKWKIRGRGGVWIAPITLTFVSHPHSDTSTNILKI